MTMSKLLLPHGNSDLDIGLIHHVFRQKSVGPWECMGFSRRKLHMYKFIFVLEGKYRATTNGKTFEINKNEALFAKKGEYYFSRSITNVFDYIEVEFVIHNNSINGELRDFYQFEKPEKIETLMLEMHKIWCEDYTAKAFQLKSLMYQLFVCLIQENEKQNLNFQYHKIKNSVAYIEENYGKNIEIKELADMCNFSLSQYNRIFKEVFNTTPKKYINQFRIARAKELLSGTNYPVISISELCGFSDNYYFCKFFKGYTGLSPLKYRAEFFRH